MAVIMFVYMLVQVRQKSVFAYASYLSQKKEKMHSNHRSAYQKERCWHKTNNFPAVFIMKEIYVAHYFNDRYKMRYCTYKGFLITSFNADTDIQEKSHIFISRAWGIIVSLGTHFHWNLTAAFHLTKF